MMDGAMTQAEVSAVPDRPPIDALTGKYRLGGLVKDWGGFERLVAELNQTGNVTVEHDVTLIGKSGAPRQMDVVIRHTEGLIEHLIIIDCKYWKSRLSRLHVDAMATAVRDLKASRGVLFSVEGFESGAITLAESEGIDLYKVRELTDDEWGPPGRHIDFFITYIEKAVANLTFPGLLGFGLDPNTPIAINLHLGDETVRTPLFPHPDILERGSLEQVIEDTFSRAAKDLWRPEVLFDGKPGSRMFWKHAEIAFNTPIAVPYFTGGLLIPKIGFDLGIRAHQTRYQFDRAAKYGFVLAIEDCVRGVLRAAMREPADTVTTLSILEKPAEPDTREILQNGSIMSIFLKGMQPFDEFASLSNGECRDVMEEPAVVAS